MSTDLIDVHSSLVETAGDRAAKFTQFIPQSFVDDLKERRKESDARPIGNLLHAFRIPVYKVEEWASKGFDVYSPEVTAIDIEARINREADDFFKVTGRSL